MFGLAPHTPIPMFALVVNSVIDSTVYTSGLYSSAWICAPRPCSVSCSRTRMTLKYLGFQSYKGLVILITSPAFA